MKILIAYMIPRVLRSCFLLAVISPITAAQSCPDNVSITTQSDVNAIADCDFIPGSVTITPEASGSLNLNGIEDIRGDLIVEGTENLNSLVLPDIESVRGAVTVRDNANLNQLGLSGLASIGSDLTVQDNPSLLDLTLNDLESVNGGMQLEGGFNSISFDNLETVRGQSSIINTGTAGCTTTDSLNTNSNDDNGSVFQGSYQCTTQASSTSTTTTTTTSTSTSTSTSSSATSTTTTATSTSTPTPGSSSNGLSGGAIAGIVIGAIVGLLLILLLGWFFIRRRRAQRKATSTHAAAVSEAAAAAGVKRKSQGHGDEEQQSEKSDSQSNFSPGPEDVMAAQGLHAPGSGTVIPRRAVSVGGPIGPDSTSPVPSILTPGTNRASMPVPSSLLPGALGLPAPSGSGGGSGAPGDPDSLFLGRVMVSNRPDQRGQRLTSQHPETEVPMLDSEGVYEMPTGPPERQQLFELDAGSVRGEPQRAINHESPTSGNS